MSRKVVGSFGFDVLISPLYAVVTAMLILAALVLESTGLLLPELSDKYQMFLLGGGTGIAAAKGIQKR